MLVRGAGNAAGFFQETIPCFSASQRSLTFLRFASQKPGCQHFVCVKCHRGWSRGLFTIEECNQVLRFPAEVPGSTSKPEICILYCKKWKIRERKPLKLPAKSHCPILQRRVFSHHLAALLVGNAGRCAHPSCLPEFCCSAAPVPMQQSAHPASWQT